MTTKKVNKMDDKTELIKAKKAYQIVCTKLEQLNEEATILEREIAHLS